MKNNKEEMNVDKFLKKLYDKIEVPDEIFDMEKILKKSKNNSNKQRKSKGT